MRRIRPIAFLTLIALLTTMPASAIPRRHRAPSTFERVVKIMHRFIVQIESKITIPIGTPTDGDDPSGDPPPPPESSATNSMPPTSTP